MLAHRSACLIALALTGSALADDKKQKFPLKVEVDTSDAPEMAAWAKTAKALLEKWHPKMVALMMTDGFEPETKVKLVFSKEVKKDGWVAFAQGNTITIS